MSRYDDDYSARGWKIAFSLVLVGLVASLVWAGIATSQKSTLQNQYNTAKSQLQQLNSSNAQSQQQCIQNAQDLFNAGAGLGGNDASNLSAQVDACKAQYPTG